MVERLERDSLGEVEVPEDALYGAQTQRAVQNFSGMQRPMPGAFLRALAQLKAAAAAANRECGVLDETVGFAIERAAEEVAAGEHREHFPVTVFQTGSGTSTNMNMNEVLAHLAALHANRPVHPNDHVNCSQSSNDMIPSALQVAAATGLVLELLPALQKLRSVLERRSGELKHMVKTGRTHLMDAMPLTLGQELGAWRAQLDDCQCRFEELQPRLTALPIGGSAIGTGVNVPEGYAEGVIQRLGVATGIGFSVANNRFSRMASQDVAVECSSALRSLAIALGKINNDLRWMSSGPLAGLSEITLEPLQPGSSIMPGKVNPVLPEAVLMVVAEIIGNDMSVVHAGSSGNFQLNVMLPLIADKICTGIGLLSGACAATCRTIEGFTVNIGTLERTLARNPILATALNTRIGYDAAASIAKRSYDEGRPVLEVAAELTDLSEQELRSLLDPYGLTGQEDNQ
jgi:fumarate hydratase class II